MFFTRFPKNIFKESVTDISYNGQNFYAQDNDIGRHKLDIKMNHWTLDTIVQKSNFVFELHNNTSEDQKFYLDSCSIMHQNIENSMLSRESSSTSTYTESESSQDNDSMGSSLSEGSYMKVKENLRLRSAASTSSNVVTSMQAGSPVEVVTIGDSETVDGVSSYWVLVTTRAGAKDKDGNSISEGTVGWCFAGFLE